MRKAAILALLAVLSVSALAWQEKTGLSHKKPRTPTRAPSGAVTQAEAVAVLSRAEKIMRSVLGIRGGPATTLKAGSAPVTNAQIVKEFDRLYSLAKPTFKFTPPKVKYDPKVLAANDAATKAALEKLVGWGFVARLGPLATSKKDGLSIPQFGDAIGFFLTRLSDLSHTPSTRWSPYLMSDRSSK
jgi:hypothetical protein